MASNNHHPEEIVLTCSICLENSVKRDPRMLPCQHTFCFSCLENYVKSIKLSKIPCPFCKEKFMLPDGDVTKVNKNLTCQLLTRITIEDPLDICYNHKKEASLFCTSHNVAYICSDCFDQNHLECKITSMKERMKLINDYFLMEDLSEAKALSDVRMKRMEISLNIEKQFESFENEIQKEFQDRKNYINEIFVNLPIEKSLKTIEKFVEDAPKFKLKDNNETIELEENYQTALKSPIVPEVTKIFSWSTAEYYNNFKHFKIGFIDEQIIFHTNLYLKNGYDLFKCIKNLPFGSKLLKIKLNLMEFKNKDFEYLCSLLMKHKDTLKNLQFEKCSLNEKQYFYIGNLLKTCNSLIYFSVCHDINLKIGIFEILNGLRPIANNLQSLLFNDCRLKENACKPIADILMLCTKLIDFEFACNYPCKSVFEKICKGLLISAGTLEVLNFKSCKLTKVHGNYLADTLIKCSSLFHFDISLNPNILNGKICLLKSLENSKSSLRYLNFYDCNFRQSESVFAVNFIKECSNLQFLNLRKNLKLKNGLIFILKHLKTSMNTLEELHFDTKHLLKRHLNKTVNTILSCKNLKKLVLSYDKDQDLDEKGLSKLCLTVLKSSKIQVFSIKSFDSMSDDSSAFELA